MKKYIDRSRNFGKSHEIFHDFHISFGETEYFVEEYNFTIFFFKTLQAVLKIFFQSMIGNLTCFFKLSKQKTIFQASETIFL